MVYEIIWTPRAISSFKRIIDYLNENWSYGIAFEFSELLKNNLLLLSTSPYMGIKSSKRKDVRKILISKHNLMYYKVEANTITILTFIDTRQHPQKNKFEHE